MEKGLALLSTESRVVTKADPRLRLLLELQPRHEVFFNNLADAILRRKPAPFKGTSPPGPFWHDVFVPTEMPWKSFQESLLWHMVVMIAAWALTQGWASRPKPHVNQSSYRASGAVYYSPSKAYPSARSSTPRQTTHATTHAKGRGASASAHAKALPVAPENRGTPKLVLPPDLKLAEGPRSPNLAADPTMPAVPLSATARNEFPGGRSDCGSGASSARRECTKKRIARIATGGCSRAAGGCSRYCRRPHAARAGRQQRDCSSTRPAGTGSAGELGWAARAGSGGRCRASAALGGTFRKSGGAIWSWGRRGAAASFIAGSRHWRWQWERNFGERSGGRGGTSATVGARQRSRIDFHVEFLVLKQPTQDRAATAWFAGRWRRSRRRSEPRRFIVGRRIGGRSTAPIGARRRQWARTCHVLGFWRY